MFQCVKEFQVVILYLTLVLRGIYFWQRFINIQRELFKCATYKRCFAKVVVWSFWSDGLWGGVGVILGLKGSSGHLQPLSLLSSSLLPRKPKELLGADCWRGYWDFGKVWSISSWPNIGRSYCLIELPRSVKGLGCFLPITLSQWMIYLVDDIKGWFHILYVIADRGVEGWVCLVIVVTQSGHPG